MAKHHGIGSLLCRQLLRTSAKARPYEGLYSVNQNVDQLISLLRKMEWLRVADSDSIETAVIEIEKIRCGVNAACAEKLADHERFEEGRFWKRGRMIEKKWRDPDDVYIDVQRREEERRKLRLPARVVALPWSAEADNKTLAAKRRSREKRRNRGSARADGSQQGGK